MEPNNSPRSLGVFMLRLPAPAVILWLLFLYYTFPSLFFFFFQAVSEWWNSVKNGKHMGRVKHASVSVCGCVLNSGQCVSARVGALVFKYLCLCSLRVFMFPNFCKCLFNQLCFCPWIYVGACVWKVELRGHSEHTTLTPPHTHKHTHTLSHS